MKELSPELAQLDLEVLHQTRPENLDDVSYVYDEFLPTGKVTSFIEDMTEAYYWADIVISRAGAGAVAELFMVNRPAILVPLASSQGGHQLENAKMLVDAGKAYLVEESCDEKGYDFTQKLLDSIIQLLNTDNYLMMRSRKVDEMMTSNAAQRIAQVCKELVSKVR